MYSNIAPSEGCSGIARLAWFCLRTQPKHEQIAAVHLTQFARIEIFHPRIRFTRSSRRGPVTVIESLFPNYLFARFDWHTELNLVQYTNGVSHIVHFGNHWPTISDDLILELRELFGAEEIRTIPASPCVGDSVLVSAGVFEGLEAIVTRVMPGSQRVAVLLDFLGRQSMVELRMTEITRNIHNEVAKGLALAI